MRALKQLSDDRRANLVQHHDTGEWLQKANSEISAVSFNCWEHVRKWKTTGAVQVKTMSGRPTTISDKHRQMMVTVDC